MLYNKKNSWSNKCMILKNLLTNEHDEFMANYRIIGGYKLF